VRLKGEIFQKNARFWLYFAFFIFVFTFSLLYLLGAPYNFAIYLFRQFFKFFVHLFVLFMFSVFPFPYYFMPLYLFIIYGQS